jgi:putative restriction endonuclease
MTEPSIRTAAFHWLQSQEQIHGETLPRTILENGFEHDGVRVPLLGPQGIFKPQVFKTVPLSITTSPNSPYQDSFREDNLLLYSYRGRDPLHRDNVGLRTAMKQRIPLIYFHGIMPGKYVASWPVYILYDNPSQLMFTVAVDDKVLVRNVHQAAVEQVTPDDSNTLARRLYVTRMVRQRLHQQTFREKVLAAYKEQCALCRLRHENLLDAAHIIPDSDPEGEPRVSNGLSLCKLHHAAFDAFMIGITPDYKIEVKQSILEESDGPMLQHGLKGMHGGTIVIPRKGNLQPNREALERRYEGFRRAG